MSSMSSWLCNLAASESELISALLLGSAASASDLKHLGQVVTSAWQAQAVECQL